MTDEPRLVEIEETSILKTEDGEIFQVGVWPPGGSISKSDFIQGEIPAGAINGSNATFTTAYSFLPGSVAVFVNGLKQRNPTDFTTTGSNTILMTDSPETGDEIRVNYIRA